MPRLRGHLKNIECRLFLLHELGHAPIDINSDARKHKAERKIKQHVVILWRIVSALQNLTVKWRKKLDLESSIFIFPKNFGNFWKK